jgi:hypothetical protein
LRTKCHGDSGAKRRMGNRKAGHVHWIAVIELACEHEEEELE